MIDHWVDPESERVLAGDAARLEAVRADRADAAARYFASHAEVWDAIRSLHVAESEVERAIDRALADRPIGRLVDIGTGTGRMIELFGAAGRPRRSASTARRKCCGWRGPSWTRSGSARPSLRQGDMYALPLDDGSADSVIIHQVLHYAQSPRAAIDEAARMLAPGGRLLVVDFAAHEREELRTRDAHVRLGFADEAMIGWFEAAGLAADHVEHLAGRRADRHPVARRQGAERRARRKAA